MKEFSALNETAGDDNGSEREEQLYYQEFESYYVPEPPLLSEDPTDQHDGFHCSEDDLESVQLDEQDMPFQKWCRVYYTSKAAAPGGRGRGVVMLLVERVFPQKANDPHWTATDLRKRVQVINVRDRTKVKPTPLPEIDYSDVPGFSTADLIQIEKQSNSVVRKRNNQATTTTTTTKGKKKKERIPYLGTAINLIGAFVSWGTLGYWGGASWAIYVVGKRFKIWAAIKALYATAREVVEATECASERWEEITEYFEDLDLEFMALIATGLFLAWGIVRKWSEHKKAFRRAVGVDSDSDSDSSEREFGRTVSEVGEDVQMHDLLGSLVQSQSELAKEIAQIKQGGGKHSPRTTTGSSGTEATLGSLDSPRNRSELSSGISSLLDRLKEHEDIVRTDAATKGSSSADPGGAGIRTGPPSLTGSQSSSVTSKVPELIQIIEKETRDPRGALMDHLQKYRDIDGWNLGGAKARIAAQYLARLYKSGKAASETARSWISEKELDTCHAAQEFLLLAMILDKMITDQKEDLINSAACEILCRRMHGLQLALQNVHRQSDWKQPRGQQGQKWKSKVQWELCDQYDVRALDENELTMPGADEEVRLRLEKKALFNKYLAKAQEGPREGDGST